MIGEVGSIYLRTPGMLAVVFGRRSGVLTKQALSEAGDSERELNDVCSWKVLRSGTSKWNDSV